MNKDSPVFKTNSEKGLPYVNFNETAAHSVKSNEYRDSPASKQTSEKCFFYKFEWNSGPLGKS